MNLITSEMAVDIDSFLKRKQALIETQLDAQVPEQLVSFNELYKAARYSLLGSGKRLRPILMLATAEVFGEITNRCLNAACALEMIHCYSLIHDDLPCMDDDDFRRGKPSLHKVFGEALAVLTGDFLLTHAFQVISEDPFLNTEEKLSLIQLFSSHSSGHGMIGGQVLDIQAEGLSIDLNCLNNIHALKTGALIVASIISGGVIGKATPKELEHLRSFSSHLGLAFQIIDDILDVTSSEKKHGKSISSDSVNNKTTYTTLMSLDLAKKTAYDLYDKALSHLEKIERDTRLLKNLAKKLVYRDI